MKFCRTLVIGLLVASSLSACGTQGITDQIKMTTPVPAPDFLSHSMVVDNVKYDEAVILDGSLQEAYKNALIQTFDLEGLSPAEGQQPKYNVDAIYDLDYESHVFDPHISHSFIATYTIHRIADGEVVFDKKITTKCDGDRYPVWAGILFGTSGQAAVTNKMIYCSAHDNVDQFIKSLGEVKP